MGNLARPPAWHHLLHPPLQSKKHCRHCWLDCTHVSCATILQSNPLASIQSSLLATIWCLGWNLPTGISSAFISFLTWAVLIYSAFSCRDAIPTSDHPVSSPLWLFQFFYIFSEPGTKTVHSHEHPLVSTVASDVFCWKPIPFLAISKAFLLFDCSWTFSWCFQLNCLQLPSHWPLEQ